MAKKKGFWSSIFGGQGANVGSANTASERLKVIVASDNRALNSRLTDDRIERMKHEILQVVNKYVNGVDVSDVNINHRKEESIDLLEMSINLPDQKQ